MKYIIGLMKAEDAKKVSKWTYQNEYSIYSMDDSAALLDELLDGSYYSVKDKSELIGYFCFGKTAQVPAGHEYGAYSDSDCIDIGLGMKPELCGKGLGLSFLLSGIEFAKKEFGIDQLRLTVADFNVRAIRVYERVGFVTVNSFTRKSDDIKFNVMICD